MDCTWAVEEGTPGLARALARVCRDVDDAIEAGARFIILTDRAAGGPPALKIFNASSRIGCYELERPVQSKVYRVIF